jgi:flagellar biosynthetic protein FliR
MLLFLAMDGHHAVIRGLDLSFQTLPVLGWPAGLGSLRAWISLCGRVFVLGLQLALPVVAALVITNMALGMIARTLPQINVFVVGLPVQIVAGLLIIWLIMGGLLQAEGEIFRQWARELRGLIFAMVPR